MISYIISKRGRSDSFLEINYNPLIAQPKRTAELVRQALEGRAWVQEGSSAGKAPDLVAGGCGFHL